MSMLTCSRCDGLNPSRTARCVHCDAALSRSRWRLTRLLGPAGAILLAACYGGPGMYYRNRQVGPGGAQRFDHDHDGALGPWQCGPYSSPDCEAAVRAAPPLPDVDCDDEDPSIYPGADDPVGDGIDQNCDGVDGSRDERRDYATPPPASVAVPPS